MARGRLITPEVKALILSVYDGNKKWKAPEIRNWVIGEVHRNPKQYFPKGVPINLSSEWPSLSKVRKQLAEIKKNLAIHRREDEPWSISTLKDYPLPPEALPRVLEEYRWHKDREGQIRQFESEALKAYMHLKGPLTIREAKWIARLSKIECDPAMPYLIAWAELLCELIGNQLDLENFDKLLAGIKVGTEDLTYSMMYLGRATFGQFLGDNIQKHDAKRIKKEAQNDKQNKGNR